VTAPALAPPHAHEASRDDGDVAHSSDQANSSPLAHVTVVLVRTEGPLNLGSVARLCGNYGCGLRLVEPRCDRLGREAVMMGHPSHALLRDAPVFATLAEAVADLEAVVGTSGRLHDARLAPVLDVATARRLLPAPPDRMGLVFGNERDGLSVGEGAVCQRLVRLHTPGPHQSLNLSHAVASTLSLLCAAAADEPATAPLSARARARLLDDGLAVLARTTFFRSSTPTHFRRKLAALVDRLSLTDHDAELLIGMVRTVAAALPPAGDGEP
jgi:tRNA/rRNA methyltransferase